MKTEEKDKDSWVLGKTGIINLNFEKNLSNIREVYEFQERLISQLREDIAKMKEEVYKDSEMQNLKLENEELKNELRNGFGITKEENEAISKWIDDWSYRNRNGNKWMGTIGGGFIYKFSPTGIGTIGTVIAPDGEIFTFRDLD